MSAYIMSVILWALSDPSNESEWVFGKTWSPTENLSYASRHDSSSLDGFCQITLTNKCLEYAEEDTGYIENHSISQT